MEEAGEGLGARRVAMETSLVERRAEKERSSIDKRERKHNIERPETKRALFATSPERWKRHTGEEHAETGY